MEIFVKIENDFQLLTIFTKNSILDISESSKYASEYPKSWLLTKTNFVFNINTSYFFLVLFFDQGCFNWQDQARIFVALTLC